MTTHRRTTPPGSTTSARARSVLPVLAASAALAVLASGCTGSTPDPAPTVTVTQQASPGPDGSSSSTSSPSSSSSSAAADGSTSGPFGPGCSSLPNGGVFPDADLTTVLGQIPQVSAFASAVDSSGLQDRIDSAGDVTVFAPTDTAFTALISSDPRLLLRPSDLLDVLSYHVVRSTVDASNIPGTFPTLRNGRDVSITGSDGTYVVNGETAITCGGIKAGSVTINVVSSVLTPPS